MNSDLLRIDSDKNSPVPDLIERVSPDRFSAAAALRLHFARYQAALRKRWWVIALCLLFIGGPAVIYAIIKPPTFRSQAVMWLTRKLNLPGGEGPFSEEMSSYMSTQADLMKSLAIQQRAFQKVRAAFPEIALLVTTSQPERLPFELSIISSPKNSVLNLEAMGPFPEATRAFLDAVMEEYLELKRGSYQHASVGALAGITDQIRDVEKQTKARQEKLTAFETANNISYLSEHGLSAGSHLSRLEELLSDLRTEHRLLELLTPEQFSEVSGDQNSLAETTLPGDRAARAAAAAMQPADAAYYQALQQLQLLKATRDHFARVLRPSHSKMVKLNQQISGFEQLLRTLKEEGGQRAFAQKANRKKSLELQIESLETQYRAWQTNAIEASSKLAEHERMKQDLLRAQGLYDRLLGLVQTVDLNKSLDQEPLAPLAPASVARANPLAKFRLAVGGIFLAFVAGFGLLLILESFDDRFISVTELSYHLPEEVIGQIPETRLRLTEGDGGSAVLRLPQEQHAFTESFRSLRSSLFFMFDESARPRVILVTSSVPKEGKSTVAAHLAASLAVSGPRVLLVDADLRRSSLHQIFGVGLKPGLREVLTKGLPVAKAIVPVRLPQALAAESGGSDALGSANLYLLPSGEAGTGGAEILLRSQVNELLRDLATQYDYVIIDSPPMLATNDATSLASKVDGVFVVVRASYTYSRMVREALDRLHKCNVKILGLVYNRAAPSTDYYYHYSRDYSSPSPAREASVVGAVGEYRKAESPEATGERPAGPSSTS